MERAAADMERDVEFGKDAEDKESNKWVYSHLHTCLVVTSIRSYDDYRKMK